MDNLLRLSSVIVLSGSDQTDVHRSWRTSIRIIARFSNGVPNCSLHRDSSCTIAAVQQMQEFLNEAFEFPVVKAGWGRFGSVCFVCQTFCSFYTRLRSFDESDGCFCLILPP